MFPLTMYATSSKEPEVREKRVLVTAAAASFVHHTVSADNDSRFVILCSRCTRSPKTNASRARESIDDHFPRICFMFQESK